MISKNISEKVLVIGPDYHNHRGGIGAVIALHSYEYEQFHFITTYKYFKSNLAKSFFFIKQCFKIFFYLLKHKDIRIVHMHTSQDGSFYRKLFIMLFVKAFFKKKIINHTNASHFHEFYAGRGRFGKKIINYYLNKCDATIVVSESWWEYYKNNFKLQNLYKIHNLSKKIAADNLLSQTATKKPLTMLFLGRIGQRKGIFDLMDVICENKDYFDGKVKLIIGGDGEDEKLKGIIQKNGLHGMVEYKNWVTGKLKEDLLNKSDIFILPSYNEGMPLSILEAMGYGKAIISTAIAGIPEIVYDGVNGKLISPGDKAALFKAINYYILNPSEIKSHGSQSLKIIKDYYPERVIPQLENIYQSLLS